MSKEQADIALSSGRIIRHRRMTNGASEAYATPGSEIMHPDEWQEYCEIRFGQGWRVRIRPNGLAEFRR